MIVCRRKRLSALFSSVARPRCYSTKPDTTLSSSGLPKPRLDYRAISDSVVYKSHNAFNRKAPIPVGAVQSIARIYAEQKELSSALNAKLHDRSSIGERIRSSGKNTPEKQAALDEAKALKAEVARLEEQLVDIEERLFSLASTIPNDSHPNSPIGPENVAVTLSVHGPPNLPASESRDHVSIGRALNLLDLEAGSTVTGSSWYYLLNEAALLEMALTNYALSIATKHGFTPVITPDVVRSDVAHRCGFQPRDQNEDAPASQMYHLAKSSPNHPELVLAGTAEIPLAGMFANKVYSEVELPLKVVGLGHAFRAEAGARGADTRGLYRVHQFTKLELFVVSAHEQSDKLMDEMKAIQTEICEGLGLSFRILEMPTEELGASAYRKYDIEAWMPGRGSWGEISSTSNCTDYQARRLHIRYRKNPSSAPDSASLPFTHTLNGTAAAVPRLIVALLENGARFDQDGSVVGLNLPIALKPFWIGGRPGVVEWV